MLHRAYRRRAIELLEQVADDGSVHSHEVLRALQLASEGIPGNIWDDPASLAYGTFLYVSVFVEYIYQKERDCLKRKLLEAAGVLRDGWSPGDVLVEIRS